MSTTMSPPQATPPESRTSLSEIQWETYIQIVHDVGENRAKRLCYYDGVLEIMSPGPSHEHSNEILDKMIFVICDETDREAKGFGTLTCIRDSMKAGMQPDCCYYFDSISKLRPGEEIDLNIDPPPDLMIEVDITRSSKRKIPILLALQVPEWWRYDGAKLEIHVLTNGAYERRPLSPLFPSLDLAEALPRFLKRREEIGDIALLREFRAWVRLSLGTK